MSRIVRIGGASGAWGDSPIAVGQLLDAGVDYLMMDYLAEVTMSLLARARMKDPAGGYPPDFIAYLKPHLPAIAEGRVKVVTNAGGVNPIACKQALEAACRAQGVSLKVAAVEGDDLMPMIESLRQEGVREWVRDEPLPQNLLTANAYLGALPIAAALQSGADIVVTGRCVDSALALGVLMHEFGWSSEAHDQLAAGSLVGHLLECGPQSTGGLFTDWQNVPQWASIGYPIAECRADGHFVITKPPGTGGIVTTQTVGEQVLYEVGDPGAYVLPDVVADFSQLVLTQEGVDRVAVRGVRGRPATSQYKVSATFQDGYRSTTLLCIIGVDAALKAERTAEALLERARTHFRAHGLPDFSATHVEVLGAEASYGLQSRTRDSREVVLRLVVDHPNPKALDLLAREVGSSGLSFAPGTAALIGGRPKPSPVVRLFTFMVDKVRLPAPCVTIGDDPSFPVPIPPGQGGLPPTCVHEEGDEVAAPSALVEVSLAQVAHARSGDKGDASNIAIFCRKPAYYTHLKRELSCERLAAVFGDAVQGPIQRFEAPGLAAFNFLMQDALGGGGTASQRIDALGKAYGQRALEMRVRVPAQWMTQKI
jgi:Acyclic terpene utilisation family protein AtuA